MFIRLVTTSIVLAFASFTGVVADEDTHQYVDNERVNLWLSKVGPYHNPQEAYQFYTLPYCAPTKELEPQTRLAGMGELLEGTELVNSDLEIFFKVPMDHTPYCAMTLDEESATAFHYAVLNHYWYQMFLDELPVWGLVGENMGEARADRETFRQHLLQPHEDGEDAVNYLYTHKSLSISYNGNQIVEVNMTADEPVEIKVGSTFDLSYSVKWIKTKKEFANRFNRYLDENFFEHHIHWFSLFNAFMMVLFLCGAVGIILMRTLKNDFARYMRDDDDVQSIEKAVSMAGVDDSGWKQVHGQVFRPPEQVEILAALIGTGAQLITMGFFVILACLAGSLYVDRGAIGTAVIVCYSVTSAAAGYVSGAFYRSHFPKQTNTNWIRVMILTAALLPILVFGVLFVINFVALAYNTVNTLPIGLMLSLFALWLFVSLPLVIVGTIVGRRFGGATKPPCRIDSVPKPIPRKENMFQQPHVMAMLAGLLPFGSIFIEMYYVFNSFWNYKFYYVYGFMLLVYVILIIVTSCISIMTTYLLLNSEDHRWAWTSFASGFSTGGYVFLYATYYFIFKTQMSGFLQTCFYFAYMGIFSTVLGLLAGTIAYMAARAFVYRIFSSVKAD